MKALAMMAATAVIAVGGTSFGPAVAQQLPAPPPGDQPPAKK